MTSAPRYQIFHKLLDMGCRWVENATTLDDAKDRLKQLALMFPGDCFILDTENACFVIPQATAPESASKKEPKERNKEYVPPTVRRLRIPR